MALIHKIYKYSILMSGLAFISITNAAVTITVPDEIVLLEVNNRTINTGILRNKKSYQVQPGDTILNVRYQQYFEHANTAHDVLKSGVLELSAPNLQDQQTYSLKLINAPKDFDEAQQYVEQPVIALVDQQNRIIGQQSGVNGQNKQGILNKINLKSVFNGESNDNSQSGVIAKHQPITQKNTSYNNVAIAEGDLDQRLIETWKKASKEQRQKFMIWLAEQ